MYIGLGSIFLAGGLTYSKKWYGPVGIYEYYKLVPNTRDNCVFSKLIKEYVGFPC